MTVTTVPLPPVRKGALWTLWLGIAALLAVGIGTALWATKPPAIGFTVVSEGKGASPTDADIALVKYRGTLADGTVFDEAEVAPMPVAGVVPGFSDALKRMRKGGSYKVVIPPALGYGADANGPIPANSTLHFDVQLLDFKSRAEVEAAQRQMQMMQQMQGSGQGGPDMASAGPGSR